MLIRVRCPNCNNVGNLFFDSPPESLPNCSCGVQFRRHRADPSLSVREKIDNGMMPKAVDRPSDISRLVENREPKSPVW